MSAETLRRAAALMRERADAATPGPWYQPPGDDYMVWQGLTRAEVARVDTGLSEGTVTEVEAEAVYEQTECLSHGDMRRVEDAAHVASWHPPVALTVADLLDDGATYLDFMAREHPDEPSSEYGQYFLAVAHAYLQETP